MFGNIWYSLAACVAQVAGEDNWARASCGRRTANVSQSLRMILKSSILNFIIRGDERNPPDTGYSYTLRAGRSSCQRRVVIPMREDGFMSDRLTTSVLM